MATHESRTRLNLGPDDAGRMLSADEFADAFYEEPWTYEREAGRLVVMSPEGNQHLRRSVGLQMELFHYWREHRDIVELVGSNVWVRIDENTDRIGDIAVFLVRPEGTEHHVPDHPPELMFEVVSPGSKSRKLDYVKKRADYHKAGIREYVIVDRFKGQMLVLTHAPEGYQERILGRLDTYETPLLPGLAIPLAEVLAP